MPTDGTITRLTDVHRGSGVRGQESRRRFVWFGHALVAAGALVLVTAVTTSSVTPTPVVSLQASVQYGWPYSGNAGSGGTAAHDADVLPTIELPATVALLDWAASVPDRNSTSIYVTATYGVCEYPHAVAVTETADSATIALISTTQEVGQVCPAMGIVGTFRVELASPIGDRTLLKLMPEGWTPLETL